MGESRTSELGSNVILCCCDSDADYCSALSSALDSLHSERVIAGWREHRVTAQNAADLLADQSSQVIVTLLSPEFLQTGFLEREELVERMAPRHPAKLALVPVLARPIDASQRTLNYSIPQPVDPCALSDAPNLAAVVNRIMDQVRAASEAYAVTRAAPETMDRTVRLPQDFSDSSDAAPGERREGPDSIGRYKIVSVLGEGAFGAVYLARDEQLDRSVAIKTPHRRRVSSSSDVESYMHEARVVAKLDHPGIVPVYDVGRTDDGQFFVVSKVIEGKDLSKRLRAGRPSLVESARLVALVAEALHYAHQHDLVHRDVKPANILIGDSDGRPFVADFGLAIHEDELGHGPTRAGTPAYMSPEQARGEGHRVDGRSDVYSLGVVLYELITGRLPFRKQNIEELLTQIAKSEAKPPRQIEPSIPRELERICLRAMSNRIMDRYTTAQDFADDLWAFIDAGPAMSSGLRSGAADGSARDSTAAAWHAASDWGQSPATESARRSSTSNVRSSTTSARRGTAPATVGRSSAAHATKTVGPAGASTVASASAVMPPAGPGKVVAKGLRAFDDHDADFFLELVPGPRDRHGVPDCLRFWKTRLEETNAERTFPVGVIYGPSGCGKTSLVRAGLIPLLGPQVQVVFLDATARDTELRLAQRIKNLCSDASPNADLPALMAWVRRGRGIPWDNKLVIVIDQFEQWLQAREQDRSGELLNALRQCDGTRVQCVLMVRVDFMMSIHRFMNDLEAPIREGANSAHVDLFDAMHAKRVLRLFGASYGRLPEEPATLEQANEAFLDHTVNELGSDGKIVPVQLALFADMCKGRPWLPETLKQVGGARGIGVTFLEETFEATTAPLEHRLHEKTCRAVLKSLLPDPGRQIRGQARTRTELAQAAGMRPDAPEFDAALAVLDRNTRLITPVEHDPGEANADGSGVAVRYQLTHDYLVPSLREWLTKRQRETARGRAEVRLDDYSRLWNDRPTPRRLPGVFDWLSMKMLTRSAQWTEPQRKMMRAAGRRVGMMTGATAAAVLLLGLSGREISRRFDQARIAAMVDQLATADVTYVPEIAAQLEQSKAVAAPLLLASYASADASEKGRLNAALAALRLGAAGSDEKRMVDNVYGAILQAAPNDLAAMTSCLERHAKHVGDRATVDIGRADLPPASVLPVAGVLVSFRPEGQWDAAMRTKIADRLVAARADAIGDWTRQLQPARGQLIEALQMVLQDEQRSARQRDIAGDLLVAYAPEEAAERVHRLVDLVEHAPSSEQFLRVAEPLKPMAAAARPLLTARQGELAKLAAGIVGEEREALGRREMYVAAALLRLEPDQSAWDVFRTTPDPTVRSLLIENAAKLGIESTAIVERLKFEGDIGARRALLLALGGYAPEQLVGVNLDEFERSLQSYVNDADAGVHGAATWLANRWVAAKTISAPPATNARDEAAAAAATSGPSWYATRENHGMVVIRGPVGFKMGSPPDDPDREGGPTGDFELQHAATIPRAFAISSKEVTVEQFLAAWPALKQRKEFFAADGKPIEQFDYAQAQAPDGDCPVLNVDWFLACAYCNWLSEREGIPPDQWCYDPAGEFKHDMVLKPGYLARTGYRLPTEAEWEYACRGGATTGRFFGEAPSLLPSYGWFMSNSKNRSRSVAQLKPNEFGLFDVYGNAVEWCLDEPRAYSAGAYNDGETQAAPIDAERLRALRGGGFVYVPGMVTSAARDRADPDYKYFVNGFRVARTMPAESPKTAPPADDVASR